MFARRLPLFKLLGFQVWIDWSWFIIALLVTWSLATQLFPALYAEVELSSGTYWAMAVAGAIGLFTSIVLHELGHSLVARRFGIEMRGITLFIFGGVAEMSDEPPNASAEFFVAIAGPAVSVVIAIVMLGSTMVGNVMNWPTPVVGVTGWLGWINLVLVAFNLVPAFPLDGGRVLRAALWQWKRDLHWATRVTSDIGGYFGVAMIVVGVLMFLSGNFIAGVWWGVIGLFLRAAATASYQRLLVRRALEGEPVARFMTTTPIAVPRSITIRELVDDYFYRHYHKMFPVTDNGHLHGCVSINDVKGIPQEEWASRSVHDIAEACADGNTVRTTDDAMQALDKLNNARTSRLMVVDDRGRLAGVLSLKDLLRFLALKTELGHEGRA